MDVISKMQLLGVRYVSSGGYATSDMFREMRGCGNLLDMYGSIVSEFLGIDTIVATLLNLRPRSQVE
jgi:hypothetical protein